MSSLRYFSDLEVPLLYGLFEMTSTVVGLLTAAIVILLLISAFFSCSEIAYSSVNIMRLKSYAEEKRRGAKLALWIAEHFDRTLTTILVGNNVVNIASTVIVGYLIANFIANPTISFVINTFGMTFLILIFGEIIPKSIGKENAEGVALKLAGPLFVTIKLLTPFVYVFMGIKKIFYHKKKHDTQPTVTESELETIIDTMEEEGVIDSDDADLIQSVLEIGERIVHDIMIPRVDVVAVADDMSVEEIKELFFVNQFSRLPVYKEDKDHIIGILSERDFFTALLKGENIVLENLISEPLFVSKAMKVDDLIRKMQSEKKHIAIVSDEYGGTSGIVTMEDALEELVGEIYDEHDDEVIPEDIVKLADDEYEILAEVPLDELFETLELGKEPESAYTNVGGFVYSLAEEVPAEDETFTYVTSVYRTGADELLSEVKVLMTFTILEVVERRITKVKLSLRDLTDEELENDDLSKTTTDSNDSNESNE